MYVVDVPCHNFWVDTSQKRRRHYCSPLQSSAAMFADNGTIPIALKNYQSSIEQPSDADCLCGKDTTFGRHPGNRMFREKVLATLPLFMAAKTKTDKMTVTRSVVDFMKRKGSRFLKLKANGSWTEIDAQATRDKVSHALRFAARQRKKQEQESQSLSLYLSAEEQEVNQKPLQRPVAEEETTSCIPLHCEPLSRAMPDKAETEKVASTMLFGSFYPIGGIQPLKPDDLPRCESGGFVTTARLSRFVIDKGDPFGIDEEHGQLNPDELECLVAL